MITRHVGNVFRVGNRPQPSHGHDLHSPGADDSQLRINRDRLEWLEISIGHASFKYKQSADQASDYCCLN